MRYLLDTNVVAAVMNERDDVIATRMIEQRPWIVLSAIVLHELYYGVFGSDRIEANKQRVEALDLPVLPFDDGDARVAGEIRATLRRRGRPIGPLDALIAGQALARDLTVVTANVREFSRVEGLRIEDWSA